MSGLCIFTHGTGANGEPLDREAEVGRLCLMHRARLTSTVVDVRELWVDLAFIVEAGSAPKDEAPKTRHLKSAEAPAPANLEVLSLRDNRTRYARIPPSEADKDGDQSEPLPPVMAMVASWVQLVAEERPITSDLLPQSTIAQLQLLQRHGDWIAGRDWVDDYLNEMGELRKALSAALRDHTHKRIGTCRLPAEGDAAGLCGGPLMKENGSEVIRCSQCRAQWVTAQEQARLAISLETA
jgi:LSD1 subclass zinc finger protein